MNLQTPPRKRNRPTRTPVQGRSKQTVERILQAATDHITGSGNANFTTNAVAERAGVNIATLYAYFPDKVAILRELLGRLEHARVSALTMNVEELGGPDWQAWVDDAVDRMTRFRQKEPAVAMRRTVLCTPELRDLDEASMRQAAQSAAVQIRRRNPSLTKRDAERISLVAIEAATEILDSACAGSRRDSRKIAELKRMLVGYLTPYLDV
jgi:AcrR family transcriptional regulator